MQPPTNQPRIVVARSVIGMIERTAAEPKLQTAPGQLQAIGGILIGKRLSATEIAIVGASTPGPAPDNQQLGFALDQTHARAMLDDWYTRDTTVDFLGLWHTHPAGLTQPTDSDVEVAQKLLVDPDYNLSELVNLLVPVGAHDQRIQCCYGERNTAQQGSTVSLVPYDVVDDDLVLQQRVVATATNSPVEAIVTPSVETIATPSLPDTVASPRRRPGPLALAAIIGLLVVLVLSGIALARRQPDASVGGGQLTPTAGIVGSSGIAAPTASTPSANPTNNAAVLPPATSTTLPILSPTSTVGLAQPTPNTSTTGEASPTATTVPEPTVVPTSNLPYALRIEVMDADYRESFLARLRTANCVGCYNIDLISPEPFQELRLTLAGSTAPPFVNYVDPSPLQFPPRPEPYTLQVRDLQGNIVSEPLSFGVTEDTLYVLRITPQ